MISAGQYIAGSCAHLHAVGLLIVIGGWLGAEGIDSKGLHLIIDKENWSPMSAWGRDLH